MSNSEPFNTIENKTPAQAQNDAMLLLDLAKADLEEMRITKRPSSNDDMLRMEVACAENEIQGATQLSDEQVLEIYRHLVAEGPVQQNHSEIEHKLWDARLNNTYGEIVKRDEQEEEDEGASMSP